MKILVACEESQEVTKAFRELGHDAYSCDLQPCSGGHPEWHIKEDALTVIGCFRFYTQDRREHFINEWDLIIAHPPCTFLTVANTYITRGCSKYTREQALQEQHEAKEFFMLIANSYCKKISIENPIGIMSRLYRKPDQIIQPYQFGEDASKSTCLWLKGLPLLKPTSYLPPRIIDGKKRWGNQTDSGQNKLPPSKERSKLRSKTYEGIAKAMAEQWGKEQFEQQLKLAI